MASKKYDIILTPDPNTQKNRVVPQYNSLSSILSDISDSAAKETNNYSGL